MPAGISEPLDHPRLRSFLHKESKATTWLRHQRGGLFLCLQPSSIICEPGGTIRSAGWRTSKLCKKKKRSIWMFLKGLRCSEALPSMFYSFSSSVTEELQGLNPKCCQTDGSKRQNLTRFFDHLHLLFLEVRLSNPILRTVRWRKGQERHRRCLKK